ncbi:MAG TPA: S9 family peptidase, partial [Lacisediminihabitans sp.]
MKPTDLPLLLSLSAPTVHPDGHRAVVAVSRPDLASDSYVGQLWEVTLDGSGSRRLSRGHHDTNPRFSPDGSLLAFLRAGLEGPAQLWVMAAAGGEALQLTEAKLGVATYRWSPDSGRIAFTAAVPEEGRYGTVKGLGADAEPPRRITALKYKANGLGYTIDRRRHVFLVDVPDLSTEPVYPTAASADDPAPEPPTLVPEARRVTFGDFDHGSIAFSPDGSRLAVVSERHPTRDVDLVSHVFEVELADPEAEPTRLTGDDDRYGVSTIAYGPAGELFFVATDLGETGTDFVGRSDQLYVIERSGASSRRLTAVETVDLGET